MKRLRIKWRDWKNPQKRQAFINAAFLQQKDITTVSVRIYAQVNDEEICCLGEGIAAGFTHTDISRGAAQMLREAADELEKMADAEDENGVW